MKFSIHTVIRYLVVVVFLTFVLAFLPPERSFAQTIVPTENTTGFLQNPAMGWVLYVEEFGSPLPNAVTYWNQQDPNRAKASILYIRVPWSRMEPTEGHYAWNEDSNYKQLVQMARDRGLKLAFRVFPDSQDVHMQATPQFVFDAGAQGYAPQSNSSFKTPYLTDAILRQKYENFITAFAGKYDDPSIVDFIDGQGLGYWGEMGPAQLGYMNSSQNIDTFRWITNLYSSKFKKVLLGGQYGNAFDVSLQEWAINEKGYMIRRDSYGSPVYFPQAAKNKIKAHFPSTPVFAENCYQGLGTWASSCDGNTSPLGTMLNRVILDAKETHANTLDLRGPQDASVWVSTYSNLVQDFAIKGGYRFVLSNLTIPDIVVSGNEYIISHTWKNTGVGKLPNDMLNWNYKYKLAFALLDKSTGQPVYTTIDPN